MSTRPERGQTTASPGRRSTDTEPAVVRAKRSDARGNRERIIVVASTLLRTDPTTSLEAIADASDVSRSTLYRHFATRTALIRALSPVAAPMPARRTLTFNPTDISRVLDGVPPHLLGDQIVAEAQRRPGVRIAAVYLVDTRGDRLNQLAGPRDFPAEIAIEAGIAVGAEIPTKHLGSLDSCIRRALPATVTAPMVLRGRATGALVAVGDPWPPLTELARLAASAIQLAESYTDVFDSVRQPCGPTVASEIERLTRGPHVAYTSGGSVAGHVLPGTAGAWFDTTESSEGIWFAVACPTGHGLLATLTGTAALAAFRAARRQTGATPATVAAFMNDTILQLEGPGAPIRATVAQWHPPTGTLSWVTCGTTQPLIVSPDGRVETLTGHSRPGLGDRTSGFPADIESDRAMVAPDGCACLTTDAAVDLSQLAIAGKRLREVGATGVLRALAITRAHHDPRPSCGAALVALKPLH